MGVGSCCSWLRERVEGFAKEGKAAVRSSFDKSFVLCYNVMS